VAAESAEVAAAVEMESKRVVFASAEEEAALVVAVVAAREVGVVEPLVAVKKVTVEDFVRTMPEERKNRPFLLDLDSRVATIH